MTDRYDAGLLNDFGGGNVEWWQDYLRAEIERANDFHADLVAELAAENERLKARNLEHEMRLEAEEAKSEYWKNSASTGAVKVTGLVEFAKEMCRIGFDGGSIDGCDILDAAVEHGLCRVTQYSKDMADIAHSEYFEEGDDVYVFTDALVAHPRATNTVDAHETANVRDKPEGPSCTCHPDDNPPEPCAKKYAYGDCVIAAEGQQEPVAWLTNIGWVDNPRYTVSFKGDKTGCENFPVYARPSEQAVTEDTVETEMVRMTVSETIRAMGGNPDEQIIGELTVFDAVAVKVRSALKAAMEAGG